MGPILFRIIIRPAGPPCVLIVFTMVHSRRPSMTRCLPAGSDLTRDFVKEQIAADVDLTEELDATSVILIVVQIVITAVGFACYCTRTVCGPAPAVVGPAGPVVGPAASHCPSLPST